MLFFFKQKTAYEMRISDWSSDVCSSDLVAVFNIGANVNFPIAESTVRVYTKVWEMACLGGFLMGREAAKRMAPRGRGTVIFTGATASLDRKSVVSGKRVSARVSLGGHRGIETKSQQTQPDRAH